MDRLTKYSKETTHENGVCCTHFGGMECFACNGDCSRGCTWEEAAWSRLAAYEDTGLTPEEVLPKDKADEIALKLMRLADLESIFNYTRLRELAEADKEGRVVVLPFTSGRTLLCMENIDSARLMKDVELAIRYCSSCGIVFHMGYNVFCDLVKHGRITAVSEETEKALGARRKHWGR